MTIPLMVNLKAIGILHVMKSSGLFTDEDKKLLQFLCSHVSVLVENARLYKNELEAKSRLEKIGAAQPGVNQADRDWRRLFGNHRFFIANDSLQRYVV